MDNGYGPWGFRRKASKKGEVKKLLADKKWTEDERLTKFCGEAVTYVHPVVDMYIAKNGAKELLQPDVFASLLAYVGESVRKNYSVGWRMIEVDEHLWEPWLVDDAGSEYPIFAPIYKELHNYRPGCSSLHGVVVGEIQTNKLRGAQ